MYSEKLSRVQHKPCTACVGFFWYWHLHVNMLLSCTMMCSQEREHDLKATELKQITCMLLMEQTRPQLPHMPHHLTTSLLVRL